MNAFDMVELARQLANLIRPGVVHQVRYSPYAVKVKTGALITQWLPPLVARAGNNRSWNPLEVGEQVLVLSPSGNPAQGWVLPAGYTDSQPAPSVDPDKTVHQFADGAVIEYDRKQHHLKAVLPAGSTTELVSDGGITFTGDLTVNGNIHATKEVSDKTRTMTADRQIYNGHTHSGVMGGPSNTGTTGSAQ